LVLGCFLLNIRYLRLKQRRLLAVLQDLNVQISKDHLTTRTNATYDQVDDLLRQYFPENLRFIERQKEISGFSEFWSRYLSLLFAGFTTVVTFFAYLLTKKVQKDGNHWFTIAFLVFFCIFGTSFLLWITQECSLIVHNNKEIHKLQRKFYFRVKQGWFIKARVLLKVGIVKIIAIILTTPGQLFLVRQHRI